MRAFYSVFAFFSMTFFAVLSAQQEGPGSAGVIEGYVTTDASAPLAAVRIGVDSLTKTAHFEAQTNTSGYYVFENVTPGAYTVWADARGFGCVVIPRVIVNYGTRLRKDFQFTHGKKKFSCDPTPPKT